MTSVREPSVNGMFYPADPVVLEGDVRAYLEGVPVEPPTGAVCGIVVPHAGYVYSGQVAAYAYKSVSQLSVDTVVVIAPSHRAYFEGLAVWDGGSFRTPLGTIPVDEDGALSLIRSSGVFTSNRDVHRAEHSLEVQLPFLQCIYNDFHLLPLLMGVADEGVFEEAAGALHKMISASGKRFLLVASTDLSHYYPYAAAIEIDRVTIDHLESFDIAGMIRDIGSEKAQACGAGPMITTMMASRKLGAQQSRVLKYANSGDVSGDRSTVVGYVSAVFF